MVTLEISNSSSETQDTNVEPVPGATKRAVTTRIIPLYVFMQLGWRGPAGQWGLCVTCPG